MSFVAWPVSHLLGGPGHPTPGRLFPRSRAQAAQELPLNEGQEVPRDGRVPGAAAQADDYCAPIPSHVPARSWSPWQGASEWNVPGPAGMLQMLQMPNH